MKKNNLLKSILIVFLLFVVLSWIIPAGYFSSGEFISGSTLPIGLFDLIIYPLITATSSVFILAAIVILLIGGLYGVLNRTGAYGKLLDNMVKKLKGKEKGTLIVVTVLFTVLSSLTGLNLPLFVFVPMVATLLMLLGYNKFTTMLATIGGILAGNMASTYGFNIAGYVSYLTENINDSIITRIVMLVLVLGVLIFTVLKTATIDKKTKEEISMYEKNIDKKAKCTGLSITLILTFIIIFVGMINWNGLFGIELFNNIHKAVTTFKLGNYDLFGKLIGTVPAIGTWTNYELSLMLIIASFIIGKLYKLSLSQIVESFVDGAKKMTPVALMMIAANIIFLLMNIDSNGYTIYNTIANGILNIGEELNAVTLGFATLIGGVFYNDFPYLLSTLYSPITSLTQNYALVGIVTQTVHGLVQFIAPTSVMLVIGLTYFDIPYTDWLKKLWKLFALLLLVIIIILIVLAIL